MPLARWKAESAGTPNRLLVVTVVAVVVVRTETVARMIVVDVVATEAVLWPVRVTVVNE